MDLSETANRKIDGQPSYGISLLSFLTKYYIQSLLVVSVVILGAVNPYFRTMANLENILLQASFAGIGAAGVRQTPHSRDQHFTSRVIGDAARL